MKLNPKTLDLSKGKMLKQTSDVFRRFFLLEFTKELIRSTHQYGELKKEFEIEKEVKEAREEYEFSPLREVPQRHYYYIPPPVGPAGPQALPEPSTQREELPQQAQESSQRIIGKPKEKKTIDISEQEKAKHKQEQPPRLPGTRTQPEDAAQKLLPSPFKLRGAMPYQQSLPPLRAPPLVIPEPILPETVQYVKPVPSPREIDLGNLNPFIRDPFVKVIECSGPNHRIVVIGSMGRKPTGISLTKEEISNVIHRFSDATRIPVHEGLFKVVYGKLSLTAIVSDITGSKFIIRKILEPRPPMSPTSPAPYGGYY